MLPNVNNILYCTDLSKNAAYAFQYAVYLAKTTGARVHILKVVEQLTSDERLTLQSYIFNQSGSEEFLQKRLDHAYQHLDQQLADFWDSMDAKNQRLREQIVGYEVVEGYPNQTILERANALECDLIIMGSHEKGWLQTLLGSVAKNVLRDSRIPVLIVPRPEDPTADE
ncbi:MAG: universal stress protein [Oceanisphaera sp.]|uniref:universal stress protein n=1 Tax=Oceanisphaera sp. TaxID=1929979 RepID=UPI003F9E4A32